MWKRVSSSFDIRVVTALLNIRLTRNIICLTMSRMTNNSQNLFLSKRRKIEWN